VRTESRNGSEVPARMSIARANATLSHDPAPYSGLAGGGSRGTASRMSRNGSKRHTTPRKQGDVGGGRSAWVNCSSLIPADAAISSAGAVSPNRWRQRSLLVRCNGTEKLTPAFSRTRNRVPRFRMRNDEEWSSHRDAKCCNSIPLPSSRGTSQRSGTPLRCLCYRTDKHYEAIESVFQ